MQTNMPRFRGGSLHVTFAGSVLLSGFPFKDGHYSCAMSLGYQIYQKYALAGKNSQTRFLEPTLSTCRHMIQKCVSFVGQ